MNLNVYDIFEEKIHSYIKTAINDLYNLDDYKIKIKKEYPFKEWDFSFLCFELANKLNSQPDKIALNIASYINENTLDFYIDEVEANSGYINFYVNTKLLSALTLSNVFGE